MGQFLKFKSLLKANEIFYINTVGARLHTLYLRLLRPLFRYHWRFDYLMTSCVAVKDADFCYYLGVRINLQTLFKLSKGLILTARGGYVAKFANLGVLDREFRGKEQLSKPQILEFRELGIANLRGLSVYSISKIACNFRIFLVVKVAVHNLINRLV